MTGLEKSMLTVFLKSQLEIEKVAFDRLNGLRAQFDKSNFSDAWIVQNEKVTEIKRQLAILEKDDKS